MRIEATQEEIADLVLALQGQRNLESNVKVVAQAICGKGQEAQEK